MTHSLLRRLSTCLLVLALGSFVFTAAEAQVIDNKGKDFFIGMMPNHPTVTAIIEVHLTADVATTVTVDYPVNSPTFSSTVAVAPDAITIVAVPNAAAEGWTPGTVQNNAIRAHADDEFVLYAVNRAAQTTDAALGLPVEALNVEYIVTSYTPVSASDGLFAVVAPFDNTVVTITPTANLAGGFSAGAPFNITLNRGEGFLGASTTSGSAGDVSGTRIQATRPVAVTNGNRCTNVPSGVFACDHIFQMAHPLVGWATSAVAAPLPRRPGGSIYRVVAGEDNTTVQRNGAVVATLDKGQFHETPIVAGPQVFDGDKTIFVTQFMTGQGAEGADAGDPAMGSVIPTEQFLSSYTFSTVGGAQFVQHQLSVIAHNTDVSNGTILLNGVAMPEGDFSPIAGTSFSFATQVLSEGTHSTQSGSNPHGVYVMGFNNFDSYLYPGGAQFEFIFAGDDTTPPVCSGNLANGVFSGTATDLLSDDPDNTGIFFVTLLAGATNLTLDVDPFTPGDEVVTFQVTQTDPDLDGSGTVRATDGAGNICTIEVFIPADGIECPPPEFSQSVHSNPNRVELFITDPEGIVKVNFTDDQDNPVLNNLVASSPQMTSADDIRFVPNDPNNPPMVVDFTLLATAQQASFFALIENACGAQTLIDPPYDFSDGLPASFALGQNYPNPFSGSTSLTFALPEASFVRVVVYDFLGRQVAVLGESRFEAGVHTLTWDGSGMSGSTLPSGTYVYRFEAGHFTATRTMTLVR